MTREELEAEEAHYAELHRKPELREKRILNRERELQRHEMLKEQLDQEKLLYLKLNGRLKYQRQYQQRS